MVLYLCRVGFTFFAVLLQASIIETDGEDSSESSPSRDMTTYSQHCFDSMRDGFSISIIEVVTLALIV